jgi:hypothetical protein
VDQSALGVQKGADYGEHKATTVSLEPPRAAAYDEQGNVHHHTRTYMEQHEGERDKG